MTASTGGQQRLTPSRPGISRSSCSFTPTSSFTPIPTRPRRGVYRGADEVIRYNQRLFEEFESVRVELDEALPAGDQVVVISRQHAVPKGGQATMVVPVAEVWKIRGGLLAERRSFATRRDALKAVGLEE